MSAEPEQVFEFIPGRELLVDACAGGGLDAGGLGGLDTLDGEGGRVRKLRTMFEAELEAGAGSLAPQTLLLLDALAEGVDVFLDGAELRSAAEVREARPELDRLGVRPADVFERQLVVENAYLGAGGRVMSLRGGTGLMAFDEAELPAVVEHARRAKAAGHGVRVARTGVFVGRQRWADLGSAGTFLRSFAAYVAPALCAPPEGGAAEGAPAEGGAVAVAGKSGADFIAQLAGLAETKRA